jgi:hypothetical protein
MSVRVLQCVAPQRSQLPSLVYWNEEQQGLGALRHGHPLRGRAGVARAELAGGRSRLDGGPAAGSGRVPLLHPSLRGRRRRLPLPGP